jgi:hypothetical protein
MLTLRPDCEALDVTHQITVIEIPDMTIETKGSCSGFQTQTLLLTEPNLSDIKWYDSGKNEPPLSEGSAFQVPASSLTVDEINLFYVKFDYEGQCEAWLSAEYNYVKTPVPSFESESICQGEELAPLVAAPEYGGDIDWYDSDQIFLQRGIELDIESLYGDISGGNHIFYITETRDTLDVQCVSEMQEGVMEVHPRPTIVIDGDKKVCGDSTKIDGLSSTYTVVISNEVSDNVKIGTILWDVTDNYGENSTYGINATGGIERTQYVDWRYPGKEELSVFVETDKKCSDTAKMSITIAPPPQPAFDWDNNGTYSVKYINETIQDDILYINGDTEEVPYTLYWDFGRIEDVGNRTEVAYKDRNEPIAVEYEYGNYLVDLEIISDYKCKVNVSESIFIDITTSLYVPNSFAPNSPSAEVSLFLPKGQNLKTYNCKVFDKWGNLIFFSDKLTNGRPAEGWDGTYDGIPAQAGSYFWFIDAEFQNHKKWKGVKDGKNYETQGSILLIR